MLAPRRFLFLQGPISPFFSEVVAGLSASSAMHRAAIAEARRRGVGVAVTISATWGRTRIVWSATAWAPRAASTRPARGDLRPGSALPGA